MLFLKRFGIGAFFCFDASTAIIAYERFLANATRLAHADHADWCHFNVAFGQAVQLDTAFVEHFAIVVAHFDRSVSAGREFGHQAQVVIDDDWSRTEKGQLRFGDRVVFDQRNVHRTAGGFLAILGGNANTFIISQESFLAETSNHALASAPTLIAFAGAGGRASGAAGLEDFVSRAFRRLGFGHHSQDRGWSAQMGGDAFAVVIAHVTLFAGAAGAAHPVADGQTVGATAVAGAASLEFFVLLALGNRRQQHLLTWHLLGDNGRGALVGRHAVAVGVSQEAGFAEASDDALFGAHRARVRVVAGGVASGTARVEDFQFAALFFERVDDGRGGDRCGVAFAGRNAVTVGVFQESWFAEATDDAVHGADRAGDGVGACGVASGTAGVEFSVGAAFFFDGGDWDRVGMDVAFLGADTFAFGIFHEAFVTETADDALERTNGSGNRLGARGHANRTAFLKFGVRAALRGNSRIGKSKPEGVNAEQQHTGKAKGHRGC
jgi:hypothetical protein